MMTREEAIDALVAQDVAKWGEEEREASRQLHRQLSHGLALNALYARAEMADDPAAPGLLANAKSVTTGADMRVLRDGG